jgi:hypothetical protein
MEVRIMPQSSQILGVNSVTNIEPGKGVLPAPIVRNADWFEKNYRSLPPTARYARSRRRSAGHASRVSKRYSLPLQDSGKLPIC